MVAYADDPKLERYADVDHSGRYTDPSLEGGSVGVESAIRTIPLYRSSNCAPLEGQEGVWCIRFHRHQSVVQWWSGYALE
jgi:hypothetical protein